MLAIWVAITAGVFTLIGQIVTAERRPKAYKRLLLLAEIWEKIPPESAARETIEQIIDATSKSLQVRKPLNPTNLALTVLLGGGLAYGTYWAWIWAVAADGISIFQWSVFVIALVATVLLVAGGVGTLRNPAVPRRTKGK
jgi:hypothetical protein